MDIASTLSQLPALGVYAIVAGLGLSEGALGGIVIPGAVTLVAAGALAATGAISFPLVILLAVAATLAGDSVGFALGRRLGDGLATTRVGRMVGATNWDRARSVVDKGGVALAASRWVGFVRSVVPVLVGASGVPYAASSPSTRWALPRTCRRCCWSGTHPSLVRSRSASSRSRTGLLASRSPSPWG